MPPGGPDYYSDTDILVGPPERSSAEIVLTALGFELLPGATRPGAHDEHWERSDGAVVDVHRTIPGVGVSDADLWAVLSRDRAEVEVAGALIPTLSVPARCVHIALHALQNGVQGFRSLRLLGGAVESVEDTVWVEAVRLAAELDATEAFAAGLRMVSAGVQLANRLDLPSTYTRFEVAALAGGGRYDVISFDRFKQTRGLEAKAQFIRDRLAPTPIELRWRMPLARRGPAGLVAAYLVNAGRVFRRALGGLVGWVRLSRRGP
jgi:hypothetical protein